MRKENKILIFLLAIIIIITVVFGFFAFQKEENQLNKSDGLKIKEEYAKYNDQKNVDQTYPFVNLREDNPFVYQTEEEIIKLLENGTGIIYFGFADCPWCRTVLPVLDAIAKEEKIEKIAYLDIKNIRDVLELDKNDKVITVTEGKSNYYKILELLDNVLEDYTLTSKDGKKIKTGEKRLYAPTVVVVENGHIESIHEGTLDSQENGFQLLTEKEVKQLTKIYQTMFQKLNEGSCSGTC